LGWQGCKENILQSGTDSELTVRQTLYNGFEQLNSATDSISKTLRGNKNMFEIVGVLKS